MFLIQIFLVLTIISLITYRKQLYIHNSNIIFLIILTICYMIYSDKYNKNEIRENMVGSLTGGFENTLRNGVERFVDEAVKSTSKELVNSLNEKFKDMPVHKKKIAKQKIGKIIDHIHLLVNL